MTAAALTVAFGSGSAAAQSQGGPLRIVEPPTIAGSPVVGATLTAAGGSWSSPQPHNTEAVWEWWSCPAPALDLGCRAVGSGPSLVLGADSAGQYVFVRRQVDFKRQRVIEVIRTPVGPVARPAPGPVTPPGTVIPPGTVTPPAGTVTPAGGTVTPAATPPPAPVPTPTFDTTAPAAAPAPPQASPPAASPRRVLAPFPVVRIRGRLTYSGADVTLLSVRAPRGAKVTVRCSGECPSARWTAPSGRKATTRLSRFERVFDAGTRITILVTRKGYVGKRTTFIIRRGLAPRRSDACVSDRGRTTRCP